MFSSVRYLFRTVPSSVPTEGTEGGKIYEITCVSKMIQIAFAFDAKIRRKTPFTKERRNLTEACLSENVQRVRLVPPRYEFLTKIISLHQGKQVGREKMHYGTGIH